MAWLVQHIDAVLTMSFGVLMSLMGAGIIKISKAANADSDDRVRTIRGVLSIVGPLLVIFGLVKIVFA
jgi:hypothetical protein